MWTIASTPRSGREPCAARPRTSTSQPDEALVRDARRAAPVGSVTIAASARLQRSQRPAGTRRYAYSSSRDRGHEDVARAGPRRAAAAPASMHAARPPFMS